MTVITGQARAYVNFSRWIADCPLDCGNAVALQPNQTSFYCTPPGGCGHISSVEWPSNADEIWQALMKRPMPKTRNWFPEGHNLALRSGCPHGQTISELNEETKENGVA